MVGAPPHPFTHPPGMSWLHSSVQSSSSRLTFPLPDTTISPLVSPSKFPTADRPEGMSVLAHFRLPSARYTERPLISSCLPSPSMSAAKETGPVYCAPPMPSEPTHFSAPVLLYTRLPSRISGTPSPSRSAIDGPPH